MMSVNAAFRISDSLNAGMFDSGFSSGVPLKGGTKQVGGARQELIKSESS
jgi:hypothetical protein